MQALVIAAILGAIILVAYFTWPNSDPDPGPTRGGGRSGGRPRGVE